MKSAVPDWKSVRDEEWRERLPEPVYRVCRRAGTEPAFSGKYWDCAEKGAYHCACCDSRLFASADKFDSGTGWPSFVRPAGGAAVSEREDHGHGMRRTEVLCGVCDAHLGHVFADGPPPGGLRYCINSLALVLKKDE